MSITKLGTTLYGKFAEENSRKQVICEVYGEVSYIWRAPQGGYNLVIRETRKVPEKYIQKAKPDPRRKRHWVYHINPQLKLKEGIEEGTEVYPGMKLTDGMRNNEDMMRLKSLSASGGN